MSANLRARIGAATVLAAALLLPAGAAQADEGCSPRVGVGAHGIDVGTGADDVYRLEGPVVATMPAACDDVDVRVQYLDEHGDPHGPEWSGTIRAGHGVLTPSSGEAVEVAAAEGVRVTLITPAETEVAGEVVLPDVGEADPWPRRGPLPTTGLSWVGAVLAAVACIAAGLGLGTAARRIRARRSAAS